LGVTKRAIRFSYGASIGIVTSGPRDLGSSNGGRSQIPPNWFQFANSVRVVENGSSSSVDHYSVAKTVKHVLGPLMVDLLCERFLRYVGTAWVLAIAFAYSSYQRASAQTFSIGANFTSMTYGANTGEPPDTMGAVGPNNFVVAQNDGIAIFDKAGALLSSMTPGQFWTSALGSNPGGLTDPRIVYDPMSQRWFTTMVTTDQTTNNKILFARSNASDPTQGFKGVAYTTTNNRFADFPTLGMDANGVYVGTNNFSSAGTLRSIGLYSVPKADLLAATPTLSRITVRNALSANTVGFTLQPAIDYGPKAPTDPEPLLASNNTTAGRYNFTPLTGTASAGATLGATTVKTVLTTSDPTASPQPSSTNTIDNGDDRFSSAVVQNGNFLYWTQNITVSGRSAIRWTIANASNFSIVQQGTISDPTLSLFYASLGVNAVGDVVIGYTGSSGSTYASTYAVTGTSAGGVLGGTPTFGTPVLTKAGVTYYDGSRWGDYSATTPDPADPGIFWTQQEYAAARNFSGTNWNWATQATEVIPNKPGEPRWANTGGGNFSDGGNYFTNVAPGTSDHVIFSRAAATYSVAFTGDNVSDRASVRQGNVTWNLAGATYSLTNSSLTTPSLTVAEFQGTATLNISAGALNSVNATIGGSPGGNGAVNALAGSNWTNSAALTVSGGGLAALTIADQGRVYVGTNLAIGAGGTLNVNGGTLRFDSFSPVAASTLNFTAGTIQVSGDRTIDSDGAIGAFFGVPPTISTGKQLVVEGNATISAAAPITLAGGMLAAASLTMSSGSQLVSTLPSQVTAPVSALAGSTINVASGHLTLGDATKSNGFYGNGTLTVGPNIVTLADADGAVLDSAAQVTLGGATSGGTLASAAGFTLNAGGQISGHGTIDTPNIGASPVTNSGAISGTSLEQPITTNGYVTGTGSMDNIQINGTYSPGPGAASVSLGSVVYAGALEIEIGGTTPGGEFDQLNHTLGDGAAALGGALDVSLINGFVPAANDMFEILTAVGGITATFSTTNLPALPGSLIWNVVYSANAVDLAVEMPIVMLPGDFDGNGVVDMSDYVVWRVGLGTTYTQADYDVWRSHFGQTAGGSGAAVSAIVPEPPSIFALCFGMLLTSGLRFRPGG
jgi:T5SS/PEP-CTERM-associated repeat protein